MSPNARQSWTICAQCATRSTQLSAAPSRRLARPLSGRDISARSPSVVMAGKALSGGCAGAVQDAGGGADVHVEGDADVGVASHAGDVGGFQVPAEQGCGAEYVPQAVPGPG